jgi:hypothetical protein
MKIPRVSTAPRRTVCRRLLWGAGCRLSDAAAHIRALDSLIRVVVAALVAVTLLLIGAACQAAMSGDDVHSDGRAPNDSAERACEMTVDVRAPVFGDVKPEQNCPAGAADQPSSRAGRWDQVLEILAHALSDVRSRTTSPRARSCREHWTPPPRPAIGCARWHRRPHHRRR